MVKPNPALEMNATVNDLNKIRDYLTVEAERYQMTEDATYDMLLAVTELATNSMVHGYHGRPGYLRVAVSQQDDLIVVALRDHAPVFDPTTAPPPDLRRPLAQRKLGGLGIFLSKEMVDDMRHRPLPEGGNETTIYIKM